MVWTKCQKNETDKMPNAKKKSGQKANKSFGILSADHSKKKKKSAIPNSEVQGCKGGRVLRGQLTCVLYS